MSNSTENLQTAAAAMTALSAALAANAGKPMDAASAAQVLLGAAQAAGPLISPQISLAVALGTVALNAVHAATQAQAGLTHDQLVALFALDDAAKAADAQAQSASGG